MVHTITEDLIPTLLMFYCIVLFIVLFYCIDICKRFEIFHTYSDTKQAGIPLILGTCWKQGITSFQVSDT
jgi:hypothetical protein